MVAPLSADKGEHKFNKLKVITNYITYRITGNRLNDLLILACEKEISIDIYLVSHNPGVDNL